MQNHSAPLHRASSAQETATERNSQILFSSDGFGGSGCFKLPSYCTQNPVPNIPENNQVRLVTYRGARLAAFTVEGRELICLPQAFELFLKHLVGGLHTVYTKLKRLEIVPVVCNVEQVRILRGLGAIQPGVNRCKLIAPVEFDVLYADCTTSSARPGRPSKRSAVAQFLVTGPPRFSEVCYVGTVAVTSAGSGLSPHIPEEKALPFLSKCPRLDSPYSTMALPLRLPPPPPFPASFTSPLINRSSFLVPPAPDRLLAGSILPKLDKLKIHICDLSPDVVSFTESWLSENVDDRELMLPGFQLFRRDRRERQGGGVVTYVKHGLLVSEKTEQFACSAETIWLTIRVPGSHSLEVLTVYRPPRSDPEVDARLSEELGRFALRPDVLITGDFNAPLIDWSSLYARGPELAFDRRFMDMALRSFLTQHVLFPTRVREGQQSNCLDLVLT
ncbi:Dachshund 1 [Sparganum proliferum]